MGGQLFLGFLQRNLGHAGFDLELLQRLIGRRRCRSRRRFGLCRLGAGGFFGAGLALGFLLFLGAAQALLALLEALFGVFGFKLFLLQIANFRLSHAVVLHQWNARWADVGAGAALDAVEQVVRLELFVLLAQGEEVQLLRQQTSRARLGAFAAADAGHGRRWWWQFRGGAGQQAVAGLDQRYIETGQSKAHHRPAHDQTIEFTGVQPGELQQLAHRRAEQRLDIARTRQRFAGERGDARDQRFAQQHGVVDGHASANVLAKDADIGRQAAAWNFNAGENLDKLFLTAGGVLGRKHPYLIIAADTGSAHGGDGLGLVVLDTDQHLLGLDQLHQDIDARNQLAGALAHQHVISGDIGFAFGAVDDQRVDLLRRPCGEFHRRGETGAAQAADAGFADQCQQLGRLHMPVVAMRREFDPLIQTVAVDDDSRRQHAGSMGIWLRADKADGAGGRGMQRCADEAVGIGDLLALAHPLADDNAGLGDCTDMLAERQH